MAQRSEIGAVYAAGAIQGLARVSFPASSSILTCPQDHGVAAFGIDLFEHAASLSLNVIFDATRAVALAMAALSFAIVRRHAAP